jgi:hypothetical protein
MVTHNECSEIIDGTDPLKLDTAAFADGTEKNPMEQAGLIHVHFF